MEEKIKILSDNRSAGHNYSLSDRIEAGLVLSGTEVKSAKDGKIQLKDAYGEVSDNEAWRKERPGQMNVPRGEMVAAIRSIIEADR